MNIKSDPSAQVEIHKYLNFIRLLCPLINEGELAWHGSACAVWELKKKEIFIKAGELQKNIGFITKGLIRSFYIDAKGKEVTMQFVAEKMFASHYAALLNNQPSRFYYQCLEDTTVVGISYNSIQNAYDYAHSFERFGRLIAEKICQAHHMRVEGFLFDTAEKRYLDFMASYPNLFHRISITHLSSYLGMERQSLTRIRKKQMIKS